MPPIVIYMLELLLLCSFIVASSSSSGKNRILSDGRSFIIDGKRTLFIAGSVHYPRAPRTEWKSILEQVKQNGINLIQTYVFWDLHEPENDVWNFPSDDTSNENLVAFIQEAGALGLFVHLRIAGYICAEWNFGGLPAWLRGLNATLRTYDDVWLEQLSQFVEKTLSVVRDADLLLNQGGPIAMLQIENEYGNMESNYGVPGMQYVQWLANFALSLDTVGTPWIMCQQGEGVGSAPPASIINTCNGYYCDDWIAKHTADFPDQPHLWTENWPGWFQKWGEAVPHRPAVDIAYSVARWFARGGSYMNYYMVFGGTTFGRSAGGPLIITSYDYDVQVNEYALPAEPKFSHLQALHLLLLENAQLILGQSPSEGVMQPGNPDCVAYTYKNTDECISFLVNLGMVKTCSFSSVANASVLPWSLSIFTGQNCSLFCYNTKTSIESQIANDKVYTEVVGFSPKLRGVFTEPIPGQSLGTPALQKVVVAEAPLMQLPLTEDKTDFLWYSSVIDWSRHSVTSSSVALTFQSGTDGGALFYVFLDNILVGISQGSSLVSLSIPVPTDKDATSNLSILSQSIGLTNYGPFLETIKVGIVSDVRLDDRVLRGFVHTVGLLGESLNIAKGDSNPIVSGSVCSGTLCWYTMTFHTPTGLTALGTPLALDLGRSMGKGSAWVNGHMLGRYWNTTATGVCNECVSSQYVGSYDSERCRSGCGEPSQTFYKLPVEWLLPVGVQENTFVLFEERGAIPDNIKLMKVSMEKVA